MTEDETWEARQQRYDVADALLAVGAQLGGLVAS